MTVLGDILEWGKLRPAWQQAALQLLYETPQLSTESRDLVVSLCRKAAGIVTEDVTCPKLELAGPGSVAAGGPTVLLGVRDVVSVNALRAGEDLGFAPAGVTLIFGDNGAGKSGYVRILKQVCRCRGGRDTVHPNAYSTNPSGTEAVVYFHSGSDEICEYLWIPGNAPPPEFRQVSIFDSRSARVYATGEQDVAYLPFGLDLFQRLSILCDSISDEFEAEISAYTAKRDPFLDVKAGTPVRLLLDAIHQTDIKPKLGALRGLKPVDAERLVALQAEAQALRVADPTARALEIELKARRITGVHVRLAALASLVGEDAAAELSVARERASTLSAAAKEAADDTFDSFPLGGLGSPTWNVLWNAAGKFAATGAEPVQPFPPTAGALCVLCQQEVNAAAAARLEAFHTFVNAAIAAEASAATACVDSLLKPLRDVTTDPFETELIDELEATEPGIGLLCTAALLELVQRVTAMIQGGGVLSSLPRRLPAVLASCDDIVRRLSADVALLRGSQEMGRLQAVESELDNLEARLQLDQVWARVDAECDRQLLIRCLGSAVKSAKTTSITNEGKEFLAQAVTGPLAAAFNANVKALEVDHVPIEFAPAKGKKGSAVHHVQLAATGTLSNEEILSEGELRAVAIAGFLAEVQLQNSASTLVFDDPVSSLDLGRREFVAKALISLAATRPVVIFTHDMPFTWMIEEAAEKATIQITERQLWRNDTGSGIVSQSIVGSGQPAKKRVGPLKQRVADLKKVYSDDPPSYEREARQIYNELRETWERGIEDALLNGALMRFGREVQTQRLKKVHLITKKQVDRLDEGMTRCSKLMRGHDQSAEIGLKVPGPDGLLADVVECEEWMGELRKLHNPSG